MSHRPCGRLLAVLDRSFALRLLSRHESVARHHRFRIREGVDAHHADSCQLGEDSQPSTASNWARWLGW